MGVRLFYRNNRRVSITTAGQALLQYAEQIVEAADAARAEIQGHAGGLGGRVAVGAPQSLSELALPAVLARFHREHPRVDIALREDANERLAELVADDTLDLALLDTTNSRAFTDVSLEDVYSDDLVVAVAPHHKLAARADVTLRALAGHPFIMYRATSGIRRTVEDACTAAGFTPRVAFESRDAHTISALAAEGLGVAVLPRRLAELEAPRVRVLPIGPRALRRTIGLGVRAGRRLSGAATAFYALVKDALREGTV